MDFPTNAKGWLKRGDRLARQGEWERAAAAYEKAIEGGGGDVAAQAAYNAGMAYDRLDRLDEAAEAFQLAVDIGQLRDRLAGLVRLAGLRHRQGDHETAVALCEEARADGDGLTAALATEQLGAIHAELGETEKALAAYTHRSASPRFTPATPELTYLAALHWEKRRNREDAVRLLRLAADSDDTTTAALAEEKLRELKA